MFCLIGIHSLLYNDLYTATIQDNHLRSVSSVSPTSYLNLANSYFNSSFQNNTNGDFYVWSETVGGGGANNFLTGIGGYLQSILNGYVGLRILTSMNDVPQDITNTISTYLADPTSISTITGLKLVHVLLMDGVTSIRVRGLTLGNIQCDLFYNEKTLELQRFYPQVLNNNINNDYSTSYALYVFSSDNQIWPVDINAPSTITIDLTASISSLPLYFMLLPKHDILPFDDGPHYRYWLYAVIIIASTLVVLGLISLAVHFTKKNPSRTQIQQHSDHFLPILDPTTAYNPMSDSPGRG